MSGLDHPYRRYEKSALWRALDVAISDLEKNKDLRLHTARPYVIGYLAERIAALPHTSDILLDRAEEGTDPSTSSG